MQPKARAMRSVSQLKKEFRFKFTFKANKLKGDMNVVGLNTSDGKRLLEVKFDNKTNLRDDGGDLNISMMVGGMKKIISIPFTALYKESNQVIEIGVEEDMGSRHFYTRMNNQLQDTQKLPLASDLGNITVVGGAKLRDVSFFFKGM